MNRSSILALVGLVLVVVGGILSFCWDAIFRFVLKEGMPLTPSSITFKEWENPSMPLMMNVYFFNWTNPEELFDKDFKPNLVEVGPYRFRDISVKTNFTWNDNSTVSYRRKKTWHFVPEESGGSLDDNITSLNPVSLSAAFVARHSMFFLKLSLSSAMRITMQKVWVTKTVREFLFDGYSDGLMALSNSLPIFKAPPGTRFGWFHPRNGSDEYDGVFNTNTGADNYTNTGLIREWNYKDHMHSFKGACGKVFGSDGSFYGPRKNKEDPVYLFTSEICRTLKLHFAGETDVKGVPGYRYTGTNSMLDSGELDPDNWCNCEGECVPYGAVNVSNCRYGSPLFVSMPHFLYAHPSYLNRLNGLSPNESRHNIDITLEPTTGFAMDVAIRLQINLLLQPSDTFAMYSDVPRIFFPVLWCEETMTLSPRLCILVKMLLGLPVFGLYCSMLLAVVGLIMLGFVFVPPFLSRIISKENAQQQKLYCLVEPVALIVKAEKEHLTAKSEDEFLMKKKGCDIVK